MGILNKAIELVLKWQQLFYTDAIKQHHNYACSMARAIYLYIVYSGVGRILVGGGDIWPSKGYHAPPAGGPWGDGPRGWQRSFKFLNELKYQKMNPLFKNINIFLARKSNFFNEKFRKIELILQRFLNFFHKLFYKFQILCSGL